MTGIALILAGSSGFGPLLVQLPATLDTTGFSGSFSSALIGPTVSGGKTPYSYSWTKISGGLISILAPGNHITNFQVSGMGIGETRVALFKCTVTDDLGAVVDSNSTTVTFERIA